MTTYDYLEMEGGIRTHGALADTLVFKTRALNHSTTPPGKKLFTLANYIKRLFFWKELGIICSLDIDINGIINIKSNFKVYIYNSLEHPADKTIKF